MTLLEVSFHLPITNPTWIFFLMLLIILFAPIVLQKLHIPHIIGMILAGVVVGKYGFNILEQDDSFKIFGKVGILYIMFLAGLEMDIRGFIQNKTKGLVFGLLTFSLPFAAAYFSSVYWIGYGTIASILLACIIADHTPLTYPIVSNMGLGKHRSVSISIGGTLVAVVLSLFTLATITGHYYEERNTVFWLLFAAKCIAYCAFTIYVYPRITRYFFRKYNDNISQYIFILALLFLSAALAELIGLEDILGAFIAGIVLNRFIPHVSPLMNRIEFVGNALFIPYFLVGVGMMIDMRMLFTGGKTLEVVGIILFVATLSKWIAAYATQKIFRMQSAERKIMFGLSNAHAAGALAMVMIGTKTLIAPNTYMMNADELNGIVMLILGSCLVSSMVTQIGAKQLISMKKKTAPAKHKEEKEKMLISLSNPETAEHLVNLALLMRNEEQNRPLIGVHIIDNQAELQYEEIKDTHLVEKAIKVASGADVKMYASNRVSTNTANSILNTLTENNCSELIVGLHQRANIIDSMLGVVTRDLLRNSHKQLMILRAQIPINTIRRLVVTVPAQAELEAGFYKWINRVMRMAEHLGCKVEFHASEVTLNPIKVYVENRYPKVRVSYHQHKGNNCLDSLVDKVNYDHLLIAVAARPSSISYQDRMEKWPAVIQRHFAHCNSLIIFPDQYGESITTFTEPRFNDERQPFTTLSGWLQKRLKK